MSPHAVLPLCLFAACFWLPLAAVVPLQGTAAVLAMCRLSTLWQTQEASPLCVYEPVLLLVLCLSPLLLGVQHVQAFCTPPCRKLEVALCKVTCMSCIPAALQHVVYC